MKLTLSWLTEHLDFKAATEEIVDRLTMIGLEVDRVMDRSKGLHSFVAARIVEARKHPDADKLQVCLVDDGAETLQVVCGAANARQGMIGVFAKVNSVIPGSCITLKKANIRGVESNGMLLSAAEMGLGGGHEGIIELPHEAKPGTAAVTVMGLDDPILDVKITPNRADCLGVRGIARDLAAAGLGKLKPLDARPVPGSFKSPINVRLDFEPDAASACPYFIGRMVRGVKNAASPKWLQDKLQAVDLRPISALVDITNYLTIGLGRPLHVFNAAKLQGGLHVRLANPGEKLAALDGKTYELTPSMTVIADQQAPQALGGVIGGELSGCADQTTDVFIECAYFDPVRTASTGRALNLLSDARFRFERGVDPAFLLPGMEIATRLVLDLCGGEASLLVVAGVEPKWSRHIEFCPKRVQALCGVDVPLGEIRRILEALGFSLEKHGANFLVRVPSWRVDVEGEPDLIEEIVRIHGYHHIPATPLAREEALPSPALTPWQRRRSLARRILAGRGLVEAVTYSFMSNDHALLFSGGVGPVRLANPISSDLDVMRPSILPNLIAACGRNADRGLSDAFLFEVGPQYAGERDEDQIIAASGVRCGRTGRRNWAKPPRLVDAFDAKADACAVLEALGVLPEKSQTATNAPPWYHPGRSGTINLGPKTVLASFGEIHPRVLDKMGVKGPIAAFEVFLDNLPMTKVGTKVGTKGGKRAAKPALKLSPLQPLERDFAFVVDQKVAADAVMRAAKNADKELITEISVFDVFIGGAVGEGKKSLAINVILQPVEKTLTDAEIDQISQKIVSEVEKATGGVLRS